MKTLDTLDDVRAAVQEVMNEGRKIISHFKRLEKEYSDWEDRFNQLNKAIEELENNAGLNKQEILEDKGIFSDIDETELEGA
jgi:predicted nuclease with TOPRIM domain